jgi:hypothetical protein
MDWLKQQDPQIIFDPSKLRTKEDWIAAGKNVFEAEIQFRPAGEQPAPADIPFPGADKNGVLPFTGRASGTSSAGRVSSR